MVRALVTQEAVFQLASTLVQEGMEPSIINIQARIGGGSYTTVKRHLDEWRKLQAAKPTVTVEIPSEILGKAEIGLRSLWLAAVALAQQAANKETEQALAEAHGVRRELHDALTELARLEQVEVESVQALYEERAQRRELELRLAALAAELEVTRVELQRARSESVAQREQSIDVGSFQATLAELQEQVADLRAAR